MRKIVFLRIICFLMIIGSKCMSIQAQHFPEDADNLYKGLSAAIEAGNYEDLKKLTCNASNISAKNEALSTGMKFPQEYMDHLKTGFLDFEKFKYIRYKKKGPITNVYYMYSESAASSIVTFCLVEEEGQLKLQWLKVRDASDFIMQYGANDYSYLENEEFQPSGKLPEIPKAVEKIDYMGSFTIACYGYTVSLTINGFLQEEIKNSTRSGIIIGGINKGENNVELNFIKTDPNEKEKPFVNIIVIMNGIGKEVFFFNEEINGKLSRTFMVE